MRIYQMVPALDYGDAVSNDAIQLHRYFQALGHESKICAMYHDRRVKKYVSPLSDAVKAGPSDILLFHFHYDNDLIPYAERFPGRRIVIYHNITPAEYFKGINKDAVYHCTRGREQLSTLARIFEVGLGDSDYNRQELQQVGFRKTSVLPIAMDLDELLNRTPDAEMLQQFKDGTTNFLFIGRIAPNKKQDELIRYFAEYHRLINGSSRLILAGKFLQDDPYYLSLQSMIRKLDLEKLVVFTNQVTDEQIAALYASAHAFICLSEHEGFCVPIVESFAFNIPVLAFAAGGIPEVMGQGGVLIQDKSTELIIHQMHALATDENVRKQVIELQKKELLRYQPDSIRKQVTQALEFAIQPVTDADFSQNEDLKVSVVVCSVKRPELLRFTLRGLASQTYSYLEVIIVHDPDDYETLEVLDEFPTAIRIPTKALNLSVSRNLGLMNATGDIVAFQDDDAVAHEYWVSDLVEGYRNPKVGAVGGIVYLGTDYSRIQFANGYINRYGQSFPVNEVSTPRPDPEGETFNYLMGTNCSFRKSLLIRLGGFDENIHFFADDGDMCIRILRLGYEVYQHPRAVMLHHFAKGFIREGKHDWRWDIIIHDNLYFGMKHRNQSASRSMMFLLHRVILRFWMKIFLQRMDAPPASGQPARFKIAGLNLGAVKRFMGVKPKSVLFKFFYRLIKGILWGFRDGLWKGPVLHSMEELTPKGLAFHPFHREGHSPLIQVGEKPLRIVMVSQDYPPAGFGGIATYSQQLAREMVRQGHEVHVVTRSYDADWDKGVHVHPLDADRSIPFSIAPGYTVTTKNLGHGFAVNRCLNNLFGNNPPDIVEGPIWDYEALVYSQKKRVPLVTRLSTPLRKMMSTHQWQADPDLLLSAGLEKKLLEHSDGIIAISHSILDTIESLYSPDWSLIPRQILPLGVPVPSASRLKPVRHEERIRVLFVGRLERRKGLHTLLEALPEIFAECPNIEVILAGKDTPDFVTGEYYGDQFRRAYSREPWANQVQFRGEVDELTKWQLYEDCDIFVGPSLYESFGIIFLEAQGLGKPVIACRAGAMPEVVKEGETGLLIEPENVKELAQAVIRLAKNPELREQFGKQGRQAVEGFFSITAAAERTIEFYKTIIRKTS